MTQSNATLPYNFVQEVRVKQGGYQAEFGRALGAIVDVVTPSGGDEFQGDLFGFFTNEALAGDPRQGILDASTEGILDYDVGGSLGGPIVRQQLWFYTAYNLNVQGKDAAIPSLGLERVRRTSHMFAGKLTWQADESTDLVLTVFGDPTTERVIAHNAVGGFGAPVALRDPDPFLADKTQGGYTASLRARSQLTSRLLLEGTVSRYLRNDDEVAATTRGRTEPLFMNLTTGAWEGGRGFSLDTRSTRTSVGGSATLFIGRHTLKGGIQYEENRVDLRQLLSSPTASQSVGWIWQPGESVFHGLFVPFVSDTRDRISTIYVQDSWRVADRLTINAGLRWESQHFIGAGDSVAQSLSNQWQPRVGFILEPGRPGSQKLFGSFGRYYQQQPLALAGAMFMPPQEGCEHVFPADPRDPTVEPTASDCFVNGGGTKKRGIEGEHADEFILGYERRLGDGLRLGARAIRREIREAYGVGFDLDRNGFHGNIGKGELDFLPRPTRTYTALELTLERTRSGPLQFLVSYVLSRAHGNYTGLFASDTDLFIPGNNINLRLPEQGPNSTGLLPNDRTHVLKLFGSFEFGPGLTVGTFFSLMSGTPRSEFGPSGFDFGEPIFLVERGSAGRTPTLWDWDVRLIYALPSFGRSARIIADIRNIGSPRRAALFEPFRFLGVDPTTGERIINPSFGLPLVHQSPMSLRIGLEVGF